MDKEYEELLNKEEKEREITLMNTSEYIKVKEKLNIEKPKNIDVISNSVHISSIDNYEENIIEDDVLSFTEDTDIKDLEKYIFDFSLEKEDITRAIYFYTLKACNLDIYNMINRLEHIYFITKSYILQEIFFTILENDKIDNILRLELIFSIIENVEENEEKNRIYMYLDNLCKNANNICVTKKIKSFCCLANFKDENNNHIYYDNSKEYFTILLNSPIDCFFKYNTIKTLEKLIVFNSLKYVYDMFIIFINNVDNDVMYRVLGCQYILYSKEWKNKEEIDKIETLLLTIGDDKEIDYKIRSNALDVLIQKGNNINIEKAKKILESMSFDSSVKTIYNNKQNIHTKKIEKYSMKILSLIEKKSYTSENVEGVLDDIKKQLLNTVETIEDKEAILFSLKRIDIDNSTYGKNNLSLKMVFVKLWHYINNSQYKNELIQRLKEEVIETAGWCSTGFVFRILNVLSGYDYFGNSISWKDQISANLGARMNKRIMNLEPEERDLIIVEMGIESKKYDERKNYLNFFRKNFSSVREELYEEYKEHVNNEKFDRYIKMAMIMYTY